MSLLQPTEPIEIMKQKAALRALECVRPGMKLGLGTGSTARYFVDGLGQKCADGLDVVCVPTSEATRAQAAKLGIDMAELGALGRLDLTVDGADEMTRDLHLVKGGGGALLREKIVAEASDRMIVIADETKLKDHLGAFALPVEVNKFAHDATADDTGTGAHAPPVSRHRRARRRPSRGVRPPRRGACRRGGGRRPACRAPSRARWSSSRGRPPTCDTRA